MPLGCHRNVGGWTTGRRGRAAAVGTTRLDLIVCQVRDTDLDAGANNDFVITVVTGVPGASPTQPPLPANALLLYVLGVPGGAANLNTATFYDWRGATRSAVWRNGAWTTTAASGQLLTFDVPEDDPYGYYNTATGLFTAPVGGRWMITANLSVAATAEAERLRCQLSRNGTVIKSGPRVSVASAQNLDAGIHIVQRMDVGETLGICYYAAAAALAGTVGQPYTWAAFDYLGP